MDNACFGNTCTGVKTQEFAEANKCSVPNTVDEVTEGCEFNYYIKFIMDGS